MLLSAAASCLAVLAVTSPPASAVDYVMIKVDPPTSNDSNVVFYGINAAGEAAGEVTLDVSSTPVRHACVWLPYDNYGLSAGLNILDNDFEDFERSAAFDINDAGIIVGQLVIDGDLFPYVWDLSGEYGSGPILDNNKDPLLGAAGLDINNDEKPLIVGGAGFFLQDPGSAGAARNGFIHNLATEDTTILTPGAGYSSALGISDTDSEDGFLAAGFASCSGIGCTQLPCEQQVGGLWWRSSTAGSLEEIDECDVDEPARTVGYAVTSDLRIVGLGNDPNDSCGTLCTARRALIWPQDDPTSTPAPLPRLDEAAMDPSDENAAYDVRGTFGSGPFEIVGKSFGANHGVIWRWNSSSWAVFDLDSVTCTDGLCGVPTTTAINADGWITGHVATLCGYILIPFDQYRGEICPGDISHPEGDCPNGVVDTTDLFTILSNWDTDGNGAELAEPYDIVDVFDLFVVLGDMGCFIGQDPSEQELESLVFTGGLTLEIWNEYVSVITTTEDDQVIENYNCWMMNYISGCTTCPTCPDDNPFGQQ